MLCTAIGESTIITLNTTAPDLRRNKYLPIKNGPGIAWYLLTNFKIISCMLAYKLTSIHARQQLIKHTYLRFDHSWLLMVLIRRSGERWLWRLQAHSDLANLLTAKTTPHEVIRMRINPQLLRMRCHNHLHKSSFAMWAEQHHLAHTHAISLP